MYWNSLSKENSSTHFEIHIFELLGWDNFVNLIKTSPTFNRVSSPVRCIFTQNLDFLCQFRHSLEQVCHLGRRKKRGEDWERTKKEVFLSTLPKKDLPGQSRTPGRWEPQRPCWLLQSPKSCDIVDTVPQNLRNFTLLSFMPARCWMAPEMPTAM